jgi:hypothetical protein
MFGHILIILDYFYRENFKKPYIDHSIRALSKKKQLFLLFIKINYAVCGYARQKTSITFSASFPCSP